MTNSILDSVKKKLGLSPDYDVFDLDLVTHINTTFLTLQQLGVGPISGFMIDDADATWDAFLGDDILLNSVKTYVYLKVKIIFDPPGTSFHLAAAEKVIQELEWRMMIHVESDAPVIVDPGSPPDPATPIFADVDGGGADVGD